MRWIALLAVAAACHAFPAHAGPADDLARLAKGFEDAALRIEDNSMKPKEIVRWDSTIVLAFVNPTGASRQANLMSKVVREIAAIAGVAVREVEATDPAANFFGKYSDSANAGFGIDGGTSNCFSTTNFEKGRIERVDINIGSRPRSGGDRCVVHEALHGFGFNSHPHGLDSVLSYVYNREALTPTDRLLIETLYDKRLKPGMTRAEAAPIACRILAEKTGVSAAIAEPVCAQRGRGDHVSRSSDHDRP
jgi:Protein of unknown function (DUF2927)